MTHCPSCAAPAPSRQARWCASCGASLLVRPGLSLGGCLLLDRLGVGSMSEVWRARAEDGSPRAVKILSASLFQHPAQRDELMDRFQREVSVLGRLSRGQPYFAPPLAYGTAPDERPFFVMELLPGEPLSRRLAAGPFPRGELRALCAQLFDALSALHTASPPVIHRDLKPENLVWEPRAPRLTLLDFGLAKLTRSAALTRTGRALGTPRYMAPEQWRNAKAVDPRADLYAAALLLYELLAGRHPFADADHDFLQMMNAHLHRSIPPLGTVAPGISGALESLLGRALSKDPAQRPASADEFWRALEAALPA